MTDYHKIEKRKLIADLKYWQGVAAMLAAKNGSELLLRENEQRTRDLVRERQRTAELKGIIAGDIENDVPSDNVPVPYSLTGQAVEYMESKK